MNTIFEERILKFKQQQQKYKNTSDKWIVARALLFFSVFLFPYLFFRYTSTILAAFAFVFFLAFFLIAVKKHLATDRLFRKLGFLVNINQDELGRLNRVFLREETGLAFLDKSHFYASDLDLFGKKSLFKLLNRTHTANGSALLAEWMLAPTSKENIIKRQSKAKELSDKIDFRQEFEATSMLYDQQDFSTVQLYKWIDACDESATKAWFYRFTFLLPLLFIATVFAWFFEFFPVGAIAICFAINAYFLRIISKNINQEINQINSFSGSLLAYIEMIKIFENEKFEHTGLKNLQEKISKTDGILKQLNHIAKNLSNRSNPFFLVTLSIPLLWDYWYYSKLIRWKSAYKHTLKECISVVSEIEVLNSISGFKYAHPGYVNPKVSDETFLLKTLGVGHPIIQPQKRKNNDFEINKLGQVVILTGSNMSGKSTFQRTLGVNIVLAQMGAVVCAERFECSCMQLFTSMRSNDSLEEDTSSFYAELKRLEILLKTLKENNNSVPILYFLDEILKGTNSKDRHSGGKALIKQLHLLKASGLISTHDVELGEEHEGKDYISNYSFNSTTSHGKLIFDYQLQKGVCQSFNATELMRQIGIVVDQA